MLVMKALRNNGGSNTPAQVEETEAQKTATQRLQGLLGTLSPPENKDGISQSTDSP